MSQGVAPRILATSIHPPPPNHVLQSKSWKEEPPPPFLTPLKKCGDPKFLFSGACGNKLGSTTTEFLWQVSIVS